MKRVKRLKYSLRKAVQNAIKRGNAIKAYWDKLSRLEKKE